MSERWTSPLIGDKVDIVPGALQVDEASSTVTYVGWAAPGSSSGESLWRIMKIDTTSGVAITWANGNREMNNSWNARAGLSYS